VRCLVTAAWLRICDFEKVGWRGRVERPSWWFGEIVISCLPPRVVVGEEGLHLWTVDGSEYHVGSVS